MQVLSEPGGVAMVMPMRYRCTLLQRAANGWWIRVHSIMSAMATKETNFAPNLRLTTTEGRVTARDSEGHQVTMLLSDDHWRNEIAQGWTSPVYGRKEPAQILRLTLRATAPVECCVLLHYQASDRNDVGCFERLSMPSDRVQIYRHIHCGLYQEII